MLSRTSSPKVNTIGKSDTLPEQNDSENDYGIAKSKMFGKMQKLPWTAYSYMKMIGLSIYCSASWMSKQTNKQKTFHTILYRLRDSFILHHGEKLMLFAFILAQTDKFRVYTV